MAMKRGRLFFKQNSLFLFKKTSIANELITKLCKKVYN